MRSNVLALLDTPLVSTFSHVGAAAVLVLASTGPAFAGMVNVTGGANATIAGCIGPALDLSAVSGSIEGRQTCLALSGAGSGTGLYAGRAGDGAVGALSGADATAGGLAGHVTAITSAARYQTEVTFTGPTPFVNVGFRIQADGAVLASLNPGGSFGSNLKAFASLNGSPLLEEIEVRLGFGGAPIINRVGTNIFGPPRISAGGVLFEDGGIVESVLFPVRTGVPLDFILSIAANANAVAIGFSDPETGLLTAGSSSGRTDVLNTLSLPSTGFVFALPDGYDAFSADGAIVNNLWTFAPRPAAVAEPGTLALLSLGLAGLGLSRRRKVA